MPVQMFHEYVVLVAGEPQATLLPARQQIQRQESVKHILLVEDDLDLARVEVSILTASGYRVDAISRGEEAIISLREDLPVLVILDLELTDQTSGWDVLRTLREVSRTIPVLLTTSTSKPIRTQIRSWGEGRQTLDYLLKPYSMPVLLQRVHRILTGDTTHR